MKTCPYCAESIRTEAVRCRYCRSRLGGIGSGAWHRDHPEARVAGVASALARSFGFPVAGMRLAFVLLTLFHLLGPLLYGMLWLVIPLSADGESQLERMLRKCLDWSRNLGGVAGGPPEESNQGGTAGAKPPASLDSTGQSPPGSPTPHGR